MLLVLIGSSGVGKTTIADRLVQDEIAERLITNTTRIQRGGDSDRAYKFVSKAEFCKLDLVESAEYAGELYGLDRAELAKVTVDAGRDYVVVLEWAGAKAVKSLLGRQAFLCYVDAPNEQIIERIKKSDRADKDKRISRIKKDRACMPHCNYLVVNADGELDRVVEKMKLALRLMRRRG